MPNPLRPMPSALAGWFVGPPCSCLDRVPGALPEPHPSPATFPRDLEDPDLGPYLPSREGQVQAMALEIQPG
jgi:hypothetical protein